MSDTAPQTAAERLRESRKGAVPTVALLLFFGVVEPLIVLGVVFSVAPVGPALLVAAAMLGFPPLLFWGLNQCLWRPTATRYPPRRQLDGAEVRTMQSASLGGLSRFNNCVHIAADADCLHLIPFWPMRVFGATVISIPWAEMTNVKGPVLGMMSASLPDGRRIGAPKWCMQLAALDDVDGAGESDRDRRA